MELPQPRGPLSAAVHARLSAPEGPRRIALPQVGDIHVLDEDPQLALWVLHHLSAGGFDGVSMVLEQDLDLLGLRHDLDAEFESLLRSETRTKVREHLSGPGAVGDQLLAMAAEENGPSPAAYLLREADEDDLMSFLRQRSIFGLKESNPQALLLAVLPGDAKVALAELLYDEFGAGRPERLHQRLFAEALQECGLDPTYGAYLSEATSETLATNNVMTLFARQYRLRGAAAGHFAAFEATSAVPSRKIAGGIERLGLPGPVAEYFHEHVEADSVHEQLAARQVCGGLVAAEPDLQEDVLFGAAACLFLDRRAAEAQLAQWRQAEPSSRRAS